MQAAVDYYEGPALVSMSVYESKTDNCSIPDMPRTTSTLPMTLPTATPTTPTPCAGDEYEIEEGDDCHSISLSEGIGTGWLLMDNNLPAWCDSFPTEGTLCLVNKCDVVTVEEGDTCHSIAFAAEITDVQLHAWNLVGISFLNQPSPPPKKKKHRSIILLLLSSLFLISTFLFSFLIGILV